MLYPATRWWIILCDVGSWFIFLNKIFLFSPILVIFWPEFSRFNWEDNHFFLFFFSLKQQQQQKKLQYNGCGLGRQFSLAFIQSLNRRREQPKRKKK